MKYLRFIVRFLFAFIVAMERTLFGVLDTRPGRAWSVSGAVLIVGAEDEQWGVEFDEDALGISISEFSVRYYLAVNDKSLQNNFGEPRARVFADKFSRDIRFSGETIGPLVFAIASAIAFANDIDDLGDGSGDPFFDEGTVTQSRAGWRKFEGQASADPLITA